MNECCEACEGSGKIKGETCQYCKGVGWFDPFEDDSEEEYPQNETPEE